MFLLSVSLKEKTCRILVSDVSFLFKIKVSMDKCKMCAVSKIAASEFSLKPYSTDADNCNEGRREENLRDGGI
jgi:hypothetical protein